MMPRLFAVWVLTLSVVTAVAADERTIWKYDKGSFEKQANGKWVQKEGDITREYAEKQNFPDNIELFDATRKVSVRLTAGNAIVTQQGKKAALEKLKGEWVAADGSKLVDKFTFWKYELGTFERQANGSWLQKEGGKTYSLREDERLPDRTDLYDVTRKIAFRIKKDNAELHMAGKGLLETLKGEWVVVAAPKGKDDPKVNPKAVGRTVWQYEKGYFEKQADGKWSHKIGNLTEEFTEQIAKVGYIEIQDKNGNVVRLMRENATFKPVGKKEGPPVKGAWVDPATVKKGYDPMTKPDSKFTEIASLKRTGQAGSFAIAPSPDGKQVAMLYGALIDAPFALVDLKTAKSARNWKLPYYVNKTAWSVDGKTLVGATQSTALRDGKLSKLYVWDTATGDERAAFDFDGFPGTLAVSADCNIVAMTGNTLGDKGVLKVWDVGAKKELLTRAITSSTIQIGMSADGKVLAMSGTGTAMVPNQVTCYDLPSGKVRTSIPCRSDFILSADGNTLVEWIYGNDGLIINVWNLKATAKGPRVIKAGKWKADNVVFLNNDQHIALGGGMTDDEVRVFDLKTLAEFDSFKLGKVRKGLTRNYIYLRATPDSAHLLTYSSDGFVRMWTTPFGSKEEAPMPKDKKE